MDRCRKGGGAVLGRRAPTRGRGSPARGIFPSFRGRGGTSAPPRAGLGRCEFRGCRRGATSSAMEYVLRSIVIGAGATLTIDVWAALLRRFGIASLNFALLGRWVGHLPRGRLV